MRISIGLVHFCTIVLLFFCLVLPAFAFKLPDTGLTKCYNVSAEIACDGTRQDGEYNINPMSFTDNVNGTVTDSNTGLIWQKCSEGQNSDDTCSGSAAAYNWYQASGVYHLGYNPSTQNICDSLDLGGHSDWRLPEKKELISLADYSGSSPSPAIQTFYFPNTQGLQYWASNPDAQNPDYAWYVIFDKGGAYSWNKSNSYYVRCVRGGQTHQSFIDNEDGTVSDLRTGLMWQQGQGYKTWQNALSYCINDVSLGGHTDWRLPNVRELESITDDTRNDPAIDTDFFPGAVSSNYWSSTTNPGTLTYAWYVRIAFGPVVQDGDKRNVFYVRCVRGGQACSSGNLAKRISGEVETYHSTIQGAYDAESNDHTSSEPGMHFFASRFILTMTYQFI